MGSVGDCYDNALAIGPEPMAPSMACRESFFATLECALLDRRMFKTKVEARIACFELIEGWYISSRRHSALGCKSPFNCERTAADALESQSP